MKLFKLTPNVSKVDMVLRLCMASGLVLVMLMGLAPDLNPSILPSLSAFLVLTALLRWDPVGYIIEIVLRAFGQDDKNGLLPNSQK